MAVECLQWDDDVIVVRFGIGILMQWQWSVGVGILTLWQWSIGIGMLMHRRQGIGDGPSVRAVHRGRSVSVGSASVSVRQWCVGSSIDSAAVRRRRRYVVAGYASARAVRRRRWYVGAGCRPSFFDGGSAPPFPRLNRISGGKSRGHIRTITFYAN